MSRAVKIPQSVLVVIHTAALDVLLIKRADALDFWQSVTGSKDDLQEPFAVTAGREVFEETGIDCRACAPPGLQLLDWHLENVYEIYPRWRHRYAAGVTRNTEHLFSLQVANGIPVILNPREHSAYRWLHWREAAEACFSPSNAEAILMLHRGEARYFTHWPELPQADFLAPDGYQAVYRTNAYTRHGEHGNALLSRWPVLDHQHEDMSDHRFEQRGLLHSELLVRDCLVHVVVVHLGLIRPSRLRQLAQLRRYITREIPADMPVLVAGDFNDGRAVAGRELAQIGLHAFEGERQATFPARLPLVQLDHVFARGLRPVGVQVLRGREWWRMSDHLPLIAEFALPD